MRNHDLWGTGPATDFTSPLCSLDPISLTGLALGGLFGAGASAFSGGGGGGGSAPTPTPAAPPPAAPAQKTPQPKQQAQQSSFIGGVPAPPPSTGQKTLLGQ